jgi:N-acetylglucosaminyldiphosphoundecaprenol N-acetyl-beta-D-mannosaminyltransferase
VTLLDSAPTVACARVPIHAVGRQRAAEIVIDLAKQRGDQGHDVHLCNAYTLALADGDARLRAMLNRADLNFPDGMSVVWANRWRHPESKLPRERVYGPDLFLDVLDQGRDAGLTHYFLGSTPDVLWGLRLAVLQRFPGVQIAGMESPPFRTVSRDELGERDERIRASGAHIVWVGLGTPKQDVEAARLTEQVPAVCIAIGAAFDFVAGTKPQAPAWLQDHGLEWAFRLATEPRRLWRRYLFGNARFVWAATRHGR